MRSAGVVALCGALLLTGCSSGPDQAPLTVPTSAGPAPASSTAPSGSSPQPQPGTGAPAARPTGPVDKACALLSAAEIEHAFGVQGLRAQEKPARGVGVAYRHSCEYRNVDVTITLDVLFARGRAGTENAAVTGATAHRADVEQVPGVGAAAAYFRVSSGDSTSGFVTAEPVDGQDSIMVIIVAKPHDHDAAKITFSQLGELALRRIP